MFLTLNSIISQFCPIFLNFVRLIRVSHYEFGIVETFVWSRILKVLPKFWLINNFYSQILYQKTSRIMYYLQLVCGYIKQSGFRRADAL